VRACRVAVVLALLVSWGCRFDEPEPAPEPGAQRASVPAPVWTELIEREELLHRLRPSLSRLSRSLRNLALPDEATRPLLDVTVDARDLAGEGPARPLPGWPVEVAERASADAAPALAPADVELWRPWLAQMAWIDDSAFQAVDGRFLDDAHDLFGMEVAVHGRGRRRDGRAVAFHADVEIRWRRRGPAGETRSWRIAGFETRHFRSERATSPDAAPFFEEVTGHALPDLATRREARRSRHAELARRRLAGDPDFEAPHPHFFLGSQDRHPGLAVVDIEGDGDDDLYVMARFGPNRLYVNQGQGQFVEDAAARGLAYEDHSAAAVFADFDNDGDPDAFVGRSLAPSLLLENVDGRFVDRSERLGPRAPGLVSSAAAADVDGDGWLDLYVSTYAAQMIVAEREAAVRAARELGRRPPETLLAEHLPEADARALYERAGEQGAHTYLSLPGPPNVLLRNLAGEGFEPVRGEPLDAFRNTYQATFGDVDGDGDADLYLANDFAPNALLRNDGGLRFADVTDETGTADVGFGMGASFGDYDRDGRLDLYVSNMFSKAGRRITRAIGELDPRFAKMARGNTLFQNRGQSFDVVSGLTEDTVQVEAAGWAWGGQFGDWNLDGWLDLYVVAGYYTAPGETVSEVDI